MRRTTFGISLIACFLAPCPVCWGQRDFKEADGSDVQASHVAFSPCGKVFASDIKLWTIRGKLTASIKSDPVSHIAFSPDGKTLACAGDGGVRLWDVETHKESKFLKGEEKGGGENTVAFSPDGATLAWRSKTTITLWHIKDGKVRDVLKAVSSHQQMGITFSPDGKTLAWANPEEIILWGIENRKPVKTIKVKSYGPPAFNPKGDMLAWRDSEKITLWNPKSHEIIHQIEGVGPGRECGSVFSADGKRLASYGMMKENGRFLPNGGILVYDVDSCLLIRSLYGKGPSSMAFSPNGEILVFGDRANGGRLEQHYVGPLR